MEIPIGEISSNIQKYLGFCSDIIDNIILIIGGTFIAGALVKYKAYRANPSQVPISRPIILLILGLALITVYFIARLSPSSIHWNS